MHLIIDPPIGPWSKKRRIRRWLKELNVMTQEYAGDESALETVDDARREAEDFLRRQKLRHKPNR